MLLLRCFLFMLLLPIKAATSTTVLSSASSLLVSISSSSARFTILRKSCFLHPNHNRVLTYHKPHRYNNSNNNNPILRVSALRSALISSSALLSSSSSSSIRYHSCHHRSLLDNTRRSIRMSSNVNKNNDGDGDGNHTINKRPYSAVSSSTVVSAIATATMDGGTTHDGSSILVDTDKVDTVTAAAAATSTSTSTSTSTADDDDGVAVTTMTTKKLFVGNLPGTITEHELRRLFEEAAAGGLTVTECSLPTDRTTGHFRGFAFVTLAMADADRAIALLHGTEIEGTATIPTEDDTTSTTTNNNNNEQNPKQKHKYKLRVKEAYPSKTTTNNTNSNKKLKVTLPVPGPVQPGSAASLLYLEEGLFAVDKPLGWTSQDVVGKIRYVLETDARDVRHVHDGRTKKRRPWMKVGHGGTLDPLATGVLVVGVGAGTKQLQQYLTGSKKYIAEVTLGYQTTTLDSDPSGTVVAQQSYNHVTSYDQIQTVLQTKFTGTIQQIPPAFSALKRDGKKLYELARQGQTADDLKIEPREVTIYNLELVVPPLSSSSSVLSSFSKNNNDDDAGDGDGNDATTEKKKLPIEKFSIRVECGGGTYIRSLVRDIGLELGTVATMTKLERTKQGSFLPEHCVPYNLLSADDDDGDTATATATGTVDANTKTTSVATNDANGVNEESSPGNDNTPTVIGATDEKEQTKNNRNNRNKYKIDKRNDCNWTIKTITDAIISSRQLLLEVPQQPLKKNQE